MKLIKKAKKGFTIIELTVVIATTSILMIGFTAFTLFFNQQYNYEMNLYTTTTSATTLKYYVANNIEKFNYTYETDDDFKTTSYVNGELALFSTITPIEQENAATETHNYYSGAIIRHYKFVEQTEEMPSYFGYVETVYEFGHSISLAKGQREVELRAYCTSDKISVPATGYSIYSTLSKMVLKIDNKEDVTGSTLCKKYTFTIHYDFVEDTIADDGRQTISFEKYIYFMK